MLTNCELFGTKGNEHMKNNDSVQKRDGFRSRGGFIIACIGSAVGMGNIWRFPMLVSTWGGLTFLIPYFIFVILIGSTGVIGEYALGRAGGAGPMGSFGMCTELRFGQRKIGERRARHVDVPVVNGIETAAIDADSHDSSPPSFDAAYYTKFGSVVLV